jgi:hypothetical protein
LRFRSPLLSQSRFLSFPPGTEMVHFPGFARARLWIHRAVRGFYPRGFPHSEIPGSKPACGSPRLIAACHVLHRLLLPRHPPCALSSLTTKFTQHTAASPSLAMSSSRYPNVCHPDIKNAGHSERSEESAFLSSSRNLCSATTRRLNSMGLVACSSRVNAYQCFRAPAG